MRLSDLTLPDHVKAAFSELEAIADANGYRLDVTRKADPDTMHPLDIGLLVQNDAEGTMQVMLCLDDDMIEVFRQVLRDYAQLALKVNWFSPDLLVQKIDAEHIITPAQTEE